MDESDKILADIKGRNTNALEIIQEVVASTHTGRFSRMMNASFYLLIEYVLYAFSLGTLIFIFIMERIAPFHVLSQMRGSVEIENVLNPHDISSFTLTVKVLIAFLAFFMFGVAYFIRKNRKYKASIQDAIDSFQDIRTDLQDNNKQLLEIEKATSKVLEASLLVANEAVVK